MTVMLGVLDVRGLRGNGQGKHFFDVLWSVFVREHSHVMAGNLLQPFEPIVFMIHLHWSLGTAHQLDGFGCGSLQLWCTYSTSLSELAAEELHQGLDAFGSL